MVLRTVLELMKLKAVHAWLDASFTELLQLLTDVLPKPNKLPKSTYYAKTNISIVFGRAEDSCVPKSLHLVSWSFQRCYEMPKVQMQSVPKEY